VVKFICITVLNDNELKPGGVIMTNSNIPDYIKGQPYVIVNNGSIVQVSDLFVHMTEYTDNEILNKRISDLFKALKAGPYINIENIEEEAGYFLFTKSLEVRFVNINVVKERNEQIYIIREKPNSRFEQRFNFLCQLCSEDIFGVAVYSAPDFTLLKANKMYLECLDVPYNIPENSLGRTVNEILTGWESSTAKCIWDNVIAKGKSEHIKEYEFHDLSGGITYWDITLIPLYEDGNIKYITLNSYEVTDRVLYKKQLEEKNKTIERQKQQLQLFVENMADGLLLLDRNNNLIMLNKAAGDFFYNPENISKKGDSLANTKYYDMEGNELTIYDFPGARILRGERVEQFILIAKRPDKTIHCSISGRPVYDAKGKIEYAVLCVRDISEKVRYELEIKEHKEQLEAILDNMQEGLLVFDKDGRYTIINKKAVECFNIGINKVGDISRFTEFYDIEGNKIPFEDMPFYRVKRGETVKEKIISFIMGGQRFFVMVSGAPIFDDKGNFSYGIISSRNITEFMQQQQELREAQDLLLQAEKEKSEALEKAIETKDEFLSLISHEFRTPINVISTAVQALNFIYSDELSEKVKEYLGTIRQNTFRQLRLVNNLLDITRANAGRIKIHKKNMDIVFLTKAITESVHQYALQKGITVTFLSSITSKIIGIDDEKYERIILNLLSNAIKFTPEGKSITVSLRLVKDNNICVEVKDRGIGIPANKLDIIFERFGQVDSSLSRQAEGTGIGLSLVKRFAEALGGSVSVKSKVGKGSTFAVLLPCEMVKEEPGEKKKADLLDNSLVNITNVEFSDIYM
jgi:PAS domain S-box